MAITTQGFSTLVQNMVTTVQGRAAALMDTTVGSVLRALLEAFAAQLLWLQAQLLALLASTRASTSAGPELDSWMADYGLVRLPAVAATGIASFARFTATAPAFIPVTGALNGDGSVTGRVAVQTQDGTVLYAVLADSSNANFDAALNQYVLTAGTVGIPVLIGALAAGAVGNAAAGQVNTLATSLPGIDTVSNAVALVNGVDAEADAALRVRFQQYLASLEKATLGAVREAALSVKEGASCDVVEGQDYSTGNARAGYFFVVADDGSGTPGSTFLTSVYNAVDAVRPLGTAFEVRAPLLTAADISLSVQLAAGYEAVATAAAVEAALNAFVATLPLGAGLPYSRLAQLAYDSSAGILNVTGMLLNGATTDIPALPRQSIKPGTITATVA
jgi:uncharacterized phage protein gp47/JayE